MKESEKADNFAQLWAANFKQLTEKDGLKFWLEFVRAADWNTLEEAIGMLADKRQAAESAGYTSATPKLPELKNIYFSLKQLARRDEEQTAPCAKCNNCGSLTVVMYNDGHQDLVCDPRKTFPAAPRTLGVYAAACGCFRGGKIIPQEIRNIYMQNNFGSSIAGNGGEQEYMEKCYRMYGEVVGEGKV